MPTYEYQCAKCKKTFDVFQSMKDDILKVCPEDLCRMKKWGKGEVKRLLGTGAGLIFKGSGFYITDYRSENYKAAAKNDTAAPASSTSDASKKETAPKKPAESAKPAKKAPSKSA